MLHGYDEDKHEEARLGEGNKAAQDAAGDFSTRALGVLGSAAEDAEPIITHRAGRLADTSSRASADAGMLVLGRRGPSSLRYR